VNERIYQRDLEHDLLAPSFECAGQRYDLRDGALELLYCFDKRGLRQGSLAGFAPKIHGLLNQTGFGVVMSQQLRPADGNVRGLAFNRLSDTRVKITPLFAQKRAVSRLLHKCVLKQISRMGGDALPEEQPGLNEPMYQSVQRGLGMPKSESGH
jgi:hypothetical protein